jgi:tripartite ATP-independent transporter DctM subunit
MTILLLFACVLALVVIDVPIAVSLGLVALVAMVATHGLGSLPNLPIVLYNGATSFPLIAIPLFIPAGAIMNASGISRRLLALASAVLGFVRGGLAMVSIGASMFFAGDLGLGGGRRLRAGLDPDPGDEGQGLPAPVAAAIMSSAATLAVIIPPSIPMILYAVMAETSVVKLFVAGIVPGIVGGFGLMGMACYFARR